MLGNSAKTASPRWICSSDTCVSFPQHHDAPRLRLGTTANESAGRGGNVVGISAVVIVVSLSFAFSTWMRTALSVSCSLIYAWISERLGLRKKSRRYTATNLRNMQRERMKELESRERSRRLTEIDSRTLTPPLKRQHGHGEEEYSTWDIRRLGGDRGFLGFRRKREPAEDRDAV